MLIQCYCNTGGANFVFNPLGMEIRVKNIFKIAHCAGSGLSLAVVKDSKEAFAVVVSPYKAVPSWINYFLSYRAVKHVTKASKLQSTQNWKNKQKEKGQLDLDLRHPTYPSYKGIKSRVFQRIWKRRTIPNWRVEWGSLEVSFRGSIITSKIKITS